MMSFDTWDRYAAALTSSHYEVAQRRVLRQLIEALLFERVLTAQTFTDQHGRTCFHMLGRMHDDCTCIYRCYGRVSDSFERIRLDATPVMRIGPNDAESEASLREFVLEMAPAIDTDEALLERFLRELEQTLLKDTLSRNHRRPMVFERNLTELEGQLQDGHPYHPCYKSRVGFDPVDNFAYGPEFEPDVKLVWLALRRGLARMRTCGDIAFDVFLQRDLGDVQYERLIAKLHSAGLSPDDYLLLPVHPWQWREKIAPEFASMLHRRDLVVLGEGDDVYRPLQSIRSLANVTKSYSAHVKLPIGIVNTSADRILSCHNVENAAPVSDWLAGICEHDDVLRGSGLVFLREVAGVTFRDANLPPFLQARQYGMLGAVWRESIENHLRAGESAAPFSGLCQCEADGRPFIAPWVERYGLMPWLDALLHATIPPLIHLLYAHGIGMEAHAQNIVLIHRHGMPSRIALKDLPGGLRFVRNCLAEPGNCPELVPMPAFRKQVNATAGMEVVKPEDVRDYFHDAVFFINFGELSLFLHEQYGLAESDYWSRVAACIHRYQANHPELAERFACFDLFAPVVMVEQLAKRRLFAETEARLQAVSNPLHRFRHSLDRAAA